MSYRTEPLVITLPLATITAIAGGALVGIYAPFAGTVTNVYAAVNGAFTVTDIVITSRINTTGITNGVVTVATAGSAFGSKGTATPTALNIFAVGDIIGCTITGGVGAIGGTVTFVLSRT